MIETPWYIDELQNALLNTDTVDPEFISDTAAEYAEACAAANERLRAIAPLLRRGLRSEVIQLAEEDPNILELVATLDFPGREDWCDLAEDVESRTATPVAAGYCQPNQRDLCG